MFESLPADQKKFKELLQKNQSISEEAITKLNEPNQTRRDCAALILEEIDISPPNFPVDKFHDLLTVMKEYNNGLETLAQKIKSHLDPGIYYA